ncbi:hypothetical protein BDFG_03709 [Blastomyces dermatitidis ATCC 26199]|nr:hypothetical protein BDFG_03709 [Blastomyces dermatitidis ATCC 26199]
MSKGHKSTEAEYIRLHYSWYGAVEIPSLRSGNYTVKERHYCSGRTQRKRTGHPPQCQAGMTWRNSTCLTAGLETFPCLPLLSLYGYRRSDRLAGAWDTSFVVLFS